MATATSVLTDPFAEIGDPRPRDVSVVSSRDDVWDARSYLVSAGSDAVLIDGNGNLAPLLAHARARGSVVHAVLLTHTHEDHVAGIPELSALGLPVLAHRDAPGGFHSRAVEPGELVRYGELEIEAIPLPGHDPAQLAYRTRGVVATGDSIYRRTVAGHAEPSESSFTEHLSGIQERVLGLPPETVILPGHGPATTVAGELAENPFTRLFSGADAPPPPRACRVGGPFGLWEAELVLLAPDYDGGLKALVRFPTIGRAMVPGSQLYSPEGKPWA